MQGIIEGTQAGGVRGGVGSIHGETAVDGGGSCGEFVVGAIRRVCVHE